MVKKRLLGFTCTAVIAGVIASGQISGPGSSLITAKAAESWKDTLLVSNGDFELGDYTGWTITGENTLSYVVKTDQWAANNQTNYLNFYAGEASDISISQTVKSVPAGTYRVGYDIEGMTETSSNEADLYINVGDASFSIGDTTGYDAWSSYSTDSFTIEEIQDITITISGTLDAGYWGDIDNIKLYRLSDDTVEADPVEAGIFVDRVDDLTYTDLSGKSQAFIEGVDVSSYVSLKNSGVKFYDFEGNELSDEEYFRFLAS